MPPSSLAWVDTSPEEQRRAREILQMFEQRESRDELGTGSIRDVLSDLMFPGMSVLQTRARYYLLVPWCFAKAAADGKSGDALSAQAKRYERLLPDALKAEEGTDIGIIGARVGAAVKTLPSDIYWNGLGTFGILRRSVSTRSLRAARSRHLDGDELAERLQSDWHPSLPAAPAGFPRAVPGGFTLTPEEAAWLRERMLAGAPGTLLKKALLTDSLTPDSPAPWLDPALLENAGEALPLLRHAEEFSRVMRGATLLYDVLVAEAYRRAGYGDGFDVEPFVSRYEDWAQLAVADERVLAWDVPGFIALVVAENPRISQLSRYFVAAWHEQIVSGGVVGASQARSGARELVAERETRLKGSQSRLQNTKLLAQWGGAGGGRPEAVPAFNIGSMTYRWPNVRRIVTDIHEGMRA